MHELDSGTLLAERYTLRRRLGGGSEIQVWLATDRLTRADVALKILAGDAVRTAELRREWQLGLRLMHPHIVRVFEFHAPGIEAAKALFSLQYIDGAPVSVLAGAPAEHVLPPLALVADALRYAHGKDIVHRDLKSANVLLDRNGAPYVIDFGVAAAHGQDIGGGSLIAASPQQLAGHPPEPADDIFALGGLVYELLAGRSPYSSAATEEDIRERVPARLSVTAQGAAISPQVVSLVAAMLAKDAAERPDAEAVVAGLREAGFAPAPAPRQYVAGNASAVDVVIDAGKGFARRRPSASDTPAATTQGSGLNPRVVATALAVLLALLLGVVFLLPRAIQAPDEPVPAAGGDEPEAAAGEEVPIDAGASAPDPEEREAARQATEKVLGQLVAQVRTLEARAVDRWGGIAWKKAREAYAAGDEAYLAKDFALAATHYEAALSQVGPLLTKVDSVFDATLKDALAALENGDPVEAVRLFDLAVAISPNHAGARAGLERAGNLDRVLALTEQGLELERDLELAAARDSFARAIEIDPEWTVAVDGLARVDQTMTKLQFDARMSEGLNALADGDLRVARAAFRRAKELDPSSSEPADGLLQVDQEQKLIDIAALDAEARRLENDERWVSAAETYEKILELDANLVFAQEGLARANDRIKLHEQLEEYLDDPDRLSADQTMQRATQLVVDITRMGDIGPRLADQRDELSRLLKRAATPLRVTLVSDDMTDVSIYKVGKLGTFDQTELELRPGSYVAVGSRPGYRDVRLEFRVAPEVDMEPVVVQCEEPI